MLTCLFFSVSKDQSTTYDHTGKTAYIDTCKKLGVVPASYYLRHMQDRHLNMSHHGLGPAGMRALAESLSVIFTYLFVTLYKLQRSEEALYAKLQFRQSIWIITICTRFFFCIIWRACTTDVWLFLKHRYNYNACERLRFQWNLTLNLAVVLNIS